MRTRRPSASGISGTLSRHARMVQGGRVRCCGEAMGRGAGTAGADSAGVGAAFLRGAAAALAATPQATVEVVAELWRSELDRRSVFMSAAWVASAFAGPTREWLLNRQDEIVQGWSGRHVGQSDIDALWEMCQAFTDVDQRLGGGYARFTLLHYVNQACFRC